MNSIRAKKKKEKKEVGGKVAEKAVKTGRASIGSIKLFAPTPCYLSRLHPPHDPATLPPSPVGVTNRGN